LQWRAIGARSLRPEFFTRKRLEYGFRIVCSYVPRPSLLDWHIKSSNCAFWMVSIELWAFIVLEVDRLSDYDNPPSRHNQPDSDRSSHFPRQSRAEKLRQDCSFPSSNNKY
jgi:hypothetical protein